MTDPERQDAGELDAVFAGLDLKPTCSQALALVRYLDLLQRWNATYNLTSVRDRAGMRSHHMADCLALIPALARHSTRGSLLDVGSGGGLPGVVIATLLPGMTVTCLDAVGKKTAFVRQVAGTLPLLNLRAVHARIEALKADPFDIVISRAFASLADFTTLTRQHMTPSGVWIAMKGRVPDDEIAALPANIEVFHVEQLQVPGLDAQRCLVWMRQTP